MDPLSVTASIIAIGTLVGQLSRIAVDVFNESKEREEFTCCLETVNLVKKNLEAWWKEEKSQEEQILVERWSSSLKDLNNVLLEMDELLKTREKAIIKRVQRKLQWPVVKKRLEEYFRRIERYCSRINISIGCANGIISRSNNKLLLEGRTAEEKKKAAKERKEVEQWFSKYVNFQTADLLLILGSEKWIAV